MREQRQIRHESDLGCQSGVQSPAVEPFPLDHEHTFGVPVFAIMQPHKPFDPLIGG
jgi:hypothetical protein